jgi:hypothetical protein
MRHKPTHYSNKVIAVMMRAYLVIVVAGIVGHELRVEGRIPSEAARLAQDHGQLAGGGRAGTFARGPDAVLENGHGRPVIHDDRVGGLANGAALRDAAHGEGSVRRQLACTLCFIHWLTRRMES